MSFDFGRYLAHIDPSHEYSVSRLTGGAVNVTVRATKKTSALKEGRFPELSSIILKYAPPYVAAVGPEATMTRTRQDIEARALSLFDSDSLLRPILTKARVRVPELLLYDSENHVIVIEDLGSLPSLSDTFAELGGHIPGQCNQHHPNDLSSKDTMPHEHHTYYNMTGRRLGSFFAHLHSRPALKAIVNSPRYGTEAFYNANIYKAVHEYAIKSLAPHLEKFADLVSTCNTPTSLFERLEADFLRPTPEEEQSFILGDCWPGAVLVSSPQEFASASANAPDIPDRSTSGVMLTDGLPNSGGLKTSIVDFEFSSFTRGPHGDIAQLMAHLELFLHAATTHKSKFYIKALEALIRTLINEYKNTAQTIAAENQVPIVWLQSRARGAPPLTQASDKIHDCPDPFSTQARIIRSALLALGGEMLNCAFWKIWPCRLVDCAAATIDTSSQSLPSQSSPTEASLLESSSATPSEKIYPKRRPSFQTYASPRGHATSPVLKSLPSSSSNESSSQSSYETCSETTRSGEHEDARIASFEEVVEDESVRSLVDVFAGHDPDIVHKCPLIRSMASNAVWLIEHAGKDTKEMCEAKNWYELCTYVPGPTSVLDDNKSGDDISGNIMRTVRRRTWLLDLFFDTTED